MCFEKDLISHRKALRAFALTLTRNPFAADDLAQETLCKAWRAQESFEPGTNFKAWLFTIARNAHSSFHRKSREVYLEYDSIEEAVCVTSMPSQEAYMQLQDVASALSRLSPEQRQALLLVTVEQLSYEEAALVLQCAVGTIKSRVFRAKQALEEAEVGARRKERADIYSLLEEAWNESPLISNAGAGSEWEGIFREDFD